MRNPVNNLLLCNSCDKDILKSDTCVIICINQVRRRPKVIRNICDYPSIFNCVSTFITGTFWTIQFEIMAAASNHNKVIQRTSPVLVTSMPSSLQFQTTTFFTSTVPPYHSIPSSWLEITSIFSITVLLPTPPRLSPLISLPAPMLAPPWRIEIYLITYLNYRHLRYRRTIH